MAFFSGLLLGLAMILPIGPQNLFVLNQGLLGGRRRGLAAAITAGLCDTTLILTGAAGLSAVLAGLPWLRSAFLAVGAIFLLYLGLTSFGGPAPDELPGSNAAPSAPATPLRSIILTGIGVSWGNPHAILDTVAVLGSAIASHDALSRPAYAAGIVTASWVFFLTLALLGTLFSHRLTPKAQIWIRRVSGALMLLFAVILASGAFQK